MLSIFKLTTDARFCKYNCSKTKPLEILSNVCVRWPGCQLMPKSARKLQKQSALSRRLAAWYYRLRGHGWDARH